MKRKAKLTVVTFMIFSAMLFSLLPFANIKKSGWPEKYTEITTTELFSLDPVEGGINYLLYLLGVSGSYQQVIVGKEGWLFLGDRYDEGFSRGRGLKSQTDGEIEAWVLSMLARKAWLASQNIPMIFSIAPNKHSVYSEFMPSWTSLKQPNSTDRLILEAQKKGLGILDLRKELIKQKQNHPYLYNKTDSHWTALGAYFGYRDLMSFLSHMVEGISFVELGELKIKMVRKSACCMANMLKIKSHLAESYDYAYQINFEGMAAPICTTKRSNLQNKKPPCETTRSRPIPTPQGLITEVSNNLSKNDLSVMFIKDSFGLANGTLMNNAFTKSWHMHYSTVPDEKKFREVINTLQPEVVIYQIVERSIFRWPFFQFSDGLKN